MIYGFSVVLRCFHESGYVRLLFLIEYGVLLS